MKDRNTPLSIPMRTLAAIFFFCILSGLLAPGQDKPFKKNAIYLSFEELRSNRPPFTGVVPHMKETDH
jgi:hypothetical protein